MLASRAKGGKGLINNTGNRDFQTIILFMETPELFEKEMKAHAASYV